MPCRLSCYGTRGNSPACELAGSGSVSIKERVTLVACGQLAIISQSARSTVKTLSISLFIELFDPRPTLTKSVHMCTIATLQIRHTLDHRLVNAELRLGLHSRKAALTTSDCAYLQVNLHKQHMYWNTAFPDGWCERGEHV